MVDITLHGDVGEIADGAGHLAVERQRYVELVSILIAILHNLFLGNQERGTAGEDLIHLGYATIFCRVLGNGQGEGEGVRGGSFCNCGETGI